MGWRIKPRISSTKPNTSPITGPQTRAHSARARKPQVILVWAMGMPGMRDSARAIATISAANISNFRLFMA